MTICELEVLLSVCDGIDTGLSSPIKLGLPPSRAADELDRKLAAKLLLADRLAGIVVPSQDEWIGLNLLERDDEL